MASARNAEAEFLSYEIALLRQGLPPKLSEIFAEPDMCVPVLPNTASYPADRQPLQPTTPLPWPDCYHSSLDTVFVRVATQRRDAAAAVKLPFDEMERQLYFQLLDQDRQRTLREAHDPTHAPSSAQGVELSQTDSADRHGSGIETALEPHADVQLVEDVHDALRSDTRDGASDTSPERDSIHQDIQNIVAMMEENSPSDTMPLAVMTYDLSTVDTVSDPQDCLEECRVLYQ